VPAAAVGLAPKCLICLAGYVGLATALGLSGAEICGPSSGSPWSWTAVPFAGLAGGAAIWWIRRRVRPSARM
jgi:hypothetical protein